MTARHVCRIGGTKARMMPNFVTGVEAVSLLQTHTYYKARRFRRLEESKTQIAEQLQRGKVYLGTGQLPGAHEGGGQPPSAIIGVAAHADSKIRVNTRR